jgi:MoxR-like ATPase
VEQLFNRIESLRANIQRVFLGNQAAVEKLLVCLLAKGHVLIEDVPGVGKTILATTLAKSLDCTMARIQMTPYLLPSDVLGVTVWDQNQSEFIFKPGPIFNNVILADEINRATPRTQSALLEAMNENQVSIDGVTRRLIQPFMVIATQNPFEFEGTYFLPESQLDRFLMRIALGYPSPDDEARVLTLQPQANALHEIEPVMTGQELLELQAQVAKVKMDQSLIDYVVRLATATRASEHLRIGVSTRGALYLTLAARATAIVNKRDYVTPDDVVSNVVPVFAHRVVSKTYVHDGDGLSAQRIMQQIIESVSSPV